jgi:LacI family gluconate utilization system Gnt-I transcriptional repressor
MQKPGQKKGRAVLPRPRTQKGKQAAAIEADIVPASQAAPAASGDRAAKVVTITDVAQRAGFGESTVSRVLRNKGSVSLSARSRILKAAADLNYVPNRIAGTLASMSSKLIGIVVPSVGNTVVPEVLAGVNTVLEAAGFQPVIGVSNYDSLREEALIESILSWRPAGILVAGLEHTDRARSMLKGCGVRVVELLDIDGEGIDIVVGSSQHMAGRKSAEHLLAHNYRNIGYVGHDVRVDIRAGKRLEGFRAVLSENDMSFVDEEFHPSMASSVEAGRIGLARLLKRQCELDAIYFSNDDLALGGYFHCLEHDISVPRDLALFGYNGLEITRLTPQPLSTIRTPRMAMGKVGANLLLSGGPSTVVDVGFELVVGATT